MNTPLVVMPITGINSDVDLNSELSLRLVLGDKSHKSADGLTSSSG